MDQVERVGRSVAWLLTAVVVLATPLVWFVVLAMVGGAVHVGAVEALVLGAGVAVGAVLLVRRIWRTHASPAR